MLYKKYHRNYVSQFKKGAKFRIFNSGYLAEVTKEPCIYQTDGGSKAIRVNYGWRLIFSGGIINKDIYVV